jgi:hypothetical protein
MKRTTTSPARLCGHSGEDLDKGTAIKGMAAPATVKPLIVSIYERWNPKNRNRKGVADMAKQFEDVGSRYGAPMGRREYGRFPLGKVRLFRVRINSGGYDDGGAYWGIGQPLYCATDDDEYREFTRAWTREDAAEQLKVVDRLKRGCRP